MFRAYLLPLSGAAALLAGTVPAAGSVLYVTSYNDALIDRVPDGGGAATSFTSGLLSPTGLTFGPSGKLFVAEQNQNRIDALLPDGTATRFASILIANASLTGMTVDPAGNLYVASQRQGLVFRVTPAGVVTTYAAGLGRNTLTSAGGPQGLAFLSDGTLLVADNAVAGFGVVGVGQQIASVTPAGVVGTFAPLPGALAVAVDPGSGDVYASSFTGGYVEHFSPAGTDLGRFATVNGAFGLAFDPDGDLLVASASPDEAVYAVPPGGGTPRLYATGFHNALFLAVTPAGDPAYVPEPAAALAVCALAGLGRRRRRPASYSGFASAARGG